MLVEVVQDVTTIVALDVKLFHFRFINRYDFFLSKSTTKWHTYYTIQTHNYNSDISFRMINRFDWRDFIQHFSQIYYDDGTILCDKFLFCVEDSI